MIVRGVKRPTCSDQKGIGFFRSISVAIAVTLDIAAMTNPRRGPNQTMKVPAPSVVAATATGAEAMLGHNASPIESQGICKLSTLVDSTAREIHAELHLARFMIR